MSLALANSTKTRSDYSLSSATDADITIPAPGGLAYRPYQKAAVAYAASRPGTLLGDEMGLGKTVEALGIINHQRAAKCLIVCPAGLKINWEREATRWAYFHPDGRNYRIAIVNSSDEWPSADIYITNYESLMKHEGSITNTFWDVAVLDEAHYIKNPKSKRSKLARRIKAAKRIAMTGTPATNRLYELFYILNWLNPREFKNWWSFVHDYCGAYDNGFGIDYSPKKAKPSELQERMRSTVMIRRMKRDVLKDLPSKIRQLLEIPHSLATELREEWKALRTGLDTLRPLRERVAAARAAHNEGEYKEAVKDLNVEMKGSFDWLIKVRRKMAMGRFPIILQHVKDCMEATNKIVVFCHHRELLEKLHASFPDSVLHYGGLSMKAKQAAIDKFRNDEACGPFFGSIKASGTGIDGLQYASSHLIFGEEDWVPATVQQAEDRLHRIGQEDRVLIQHLVLEGSLDALMCKTVMKKQEMLDRAFNLDDGLERPFEAAELALKYHEGMLSS